MTETLREKEELSRLESEALRKAREDITNLRRKVDQHNELMSEKDRTAQVRRSLALLTDPMLMHCHGAYLLHPDRSRRHT